MCIIITRRKLLILWGVFRAFPGWCTPEYTGALTRRVNATVSKSDQINRGILIRPIKFVLATLTDMQALVLRKRLSSAICFRSAPQFICAAFGTTIYEMRSGKTGGAERKQISSKSGSIFRTSFRRAVVHTNDRKNPDATNNYSRKLTNPLCIVE